MWQTILQHCFPVETVSHKAEFSSRRGYGRSDLISVRWNTDPERAGNNSRYRHRPFLVTQTKPRRLQGQNAVWGNAERQLERYMRGASADIGARRYVFGIVAIGTAAKIFKSIVEPLGDQAGSCRVPI